MCVCVCACVCVRVCVNSRIVNLESYWSWILEDALRFLGMILGFLRMFQDSQGCYGILRDVSGFLKRF